MSKTTETAARKQGPGMHGLHISKEELQAPAVAYPTIALFMAVFFTWAAIVYTVLVRGNLPESFGKRLVMVCVQTILMFLLFTPLHDAVHGAIATNKSGLRWINGVIGRCCGWAFMAPYMAFRYVHLQHHRHTNDPELDPDNWSGTGPWFILPIKWFTQLAHYYWLYINLLGKRSLKETVEVYGSIFITFFFMYRMWASSMFLEFGLVWFLPSASAAAFLAFSFDYLPHRPHQSLDKFEGTAVTTLFGNVTQPLTPVLMYQNYHNIHHLFPWLPFYQYSRVWYNHRDELRAKGTPVNPIFPIFLPKQPGKPKKA